MVEDENLGELDELAPFGGHIRESLEVRDEDRDIFVESGMRAKEVEEGDEEGEGGDGAEIGGIAGGRLVVALEGSIETLYDLL